MVLMQLSGAELGFCLGDASHVLSTEQNLWCRDCYSLCKAGGFHALDYFSWPSPPVPENVFMAYFCIYWAFQSMEELFLDVYFDFL